MAMRFCILGSGSSGNAALLVTENARILVDAGFSARKLTQLLASAGEALARVDAVFLTHEHGDHAAGIDGLKKFPHIRIFANAATARAVQNGLEHRPDWQVFQTGVDIWMPATTPPDGSIRWESAPRGDTSRLQVVNTPNWASDAHRISIQFNDYVQDISNWVQCRQAKPSPCK